VAPTPSARRGCDTPGTRPASCRPAQAAR
jgi:hypothetical protein